MIDEETFHHLCYDPTPVMPLGITLRSGVLTLPAALALTVALSLIGRGVLKSNTVLLCTK